MEKNKLKTAGAIALIVGGLIAGGMALNGTDGLETPEKQKNEKVDSDLSVGQYETLIKEADIALERLSGIIESDSVTPEERFEARIAYKNIVAERENLQKRLNTKLQNQQSILQMGNARGDR